MTCAFFCFFFSVCGNPSDVLVYGCISNHESLGSISTDAYRNAATIAAGATTSKPRSSKGGQDLALPTAGIFESSETESRSSSTRPNSWQASAVPVRQHKYWKVMVLGVKRRTGFHTPDAVSLYLSLLFECE